MKLEAKELDEMHLDDVDTGIPVRILTTISSRGLPKGAIGYKAYVCYFMCFVVIANANLGVRTLGDANPRVELVKFPITLENE